MPPKKKPAAAAQEEAPSSKRRRESEREGGAGSGAGGRGGRGAKRNRVAAVDESSSAREPSSRGGEEISDAVPKRFWEHLQCPICMDTFHNPVALLPCLHNFCASCVIGCRDCHVCRVEVEESVRNHNLASIIETFLEANPHRRRSLQDLAQLDEAVAAAESSAAAVAGGHSAGHVPRALADVLKARKITLDARQRQVAQIEKAGKRAERTIKAAEDALCKSILAAISDTKMRADCSRLVNALVHNEMTYFGSDDVEFHDGGEFLGRVVGNDKNPASLEAATAVAHAIGYSSSLKELRFEVSSNGEGMPSPQCMEIFLRHGVAKSSSLSTLTLRNDALLTEGEALELVAALKVCSTLQELSLRGYHGSDDPAIMSCFLAAVVGADCSLRHLDVLCCDITDETAGMLADKLKINTSVRELSLEQNMIGDAGAARLAEALKKNTALRKLNLERNQIADKGAVALARAEDCRSHAGFDLEELNLSQNRIADKGVAALAKMLKSNRLKLKKLLLRSQQHDDDQPLLTSKGASALADALKGGANWDLEVLDLSCNPISDAGASKIAEALKTNYNLVHVNLQGCGITDKGAGALSLALKALAAPLEILELGSNKIRDPGAKKLAEAIEIDFTLKVLSLENNVVGDKGAGALAKSLEFNGKLQELRLDGNKITDAGAKKLANSLAYNYVLARLSLDNNKITVAGAARLRDAWGPGAPFTSLDFCFGRGLDFGTDEEEEDYSVDEEEEDYGYSDEDEEDYMSHYGWGSDEEEESD